MLLLITNAIAQDIGTVIGFADSLYNERNYNLALHEYRRAFFFSEDSNKVLVGQKIAGCYLLKADYCMARSYFDSACSYSKSVYGKTGYRLQIIRCYMLEKNFETALLRLNEIGTDTSHYYSKKYQLYTAISYFGLQQYDEAFQAFNRALDPADSVKITNLLNLTEESKRLKHPYPFVASLMSALLPGTGQIYDGCWVEGANSILVLGGLTGISFAFPELVVFTVPFIDRYYVGGIIHAGQYAHERRAKKQERSYSQIMTLYPENEQLLGLFSTRDKRPGYRSYLKQADTLGDVLSSYFFIIYKCFFSSQDVDACVFNPTCSVYMMEAIKRHGYFIGFLDGVDRLLRCHPFITANDYSKDTQTDKFNDPN